MRAPAGQGVHGAADGDEHAALHTGGGLGTYDRTSPTPTCKALAAQLDPGEYWVRIEFPEEFYFRNPSIRMPGDTSSSSIVGQVGPLKVVDKQTTKAAVTLTAP
jgi:hypothetical protein